MIDPQEFQSMHNQNTPTTPTWKETLVMYMLSSLLLVTLGSIVQHLHLLSGLVVSELLFVVAPVALFTLSRRYDLKRTFYLSPIRLKTAFLTILITGSAFLLVGVIAALQEIIFPRSQGYQEIWDEILTQFHQVPLLITLVLVAVLPGVCEELLFRGFLLHGLRKKLSPVSAIVIVGILFGAFHLDPYRFLPVTLLGILFGYLVLRTGSIITGMVAHSTNNGIAMLISYSVFTAKNQGVSLPDPSESAWQFSDPQAVLALLPVLGVALLVFILSLRALPRHTPGEHAEEDNETFLPPFDIDDTSLDQEPDDSKENL